MNPSKDGNSSESDSSSPALILPPGPSSLHPDSAALLRSRINSNAATPNSRNPKPQRPHGNDNASLPSGFRLTPQIYNPPVDSPRPRNITPLRPSGIDIVSGPSSFYASPLTFSPPVTTPRRGNHTSSQSDEYPFPRQPLAENEAPPYVPDIVPSSSTAAPTSIVFEVDNPPADWPPPGWRPRVAERAPVTGQSGVAEGPGAVDDDVDDIDEPPAYRPEPSLAEGRMAIHLQLTEGRRLVGTAAQLQAQRERMEVNYTVSVKEVDVEEALARDPCKNSLKERLKEEAKCSEQTTRTMTAKDKRDEFEHTKTMLKGAAYLLNQRAPKKQERDGSRAPSLNEIDEGYQSSEAPKHIKFGPCPEGHDCERCKKDVETSESLEDTESPQTSESPDTTENPRTEHE